jgi:hypothetical protein
MSRLTRSFAVFLLLATVWVGAAFAQDDEQPAAPQEIIDAVAESDTFADWLVNYPNYQFNASGPDENGIWYVEFYDEPWEEWLGYANINETTLEIIESYAPKPLSPDVYQAQLDVLRTYVLNDAEVLAWLNNVPDLWDVYPDYNRWDQRWELGFYRGIQGVRVLATVDEDDNVWISDIIDPNVLDEATARQEARDAAIALAYTAEGVDDALNGYDDWTTYVEQQGDTVWSVSFVSGEDALFFALVDLEREEVLQAER